MKRWTVLPALLLLLLILAAWPPQVNSLALSNEQLSQLSQGEVVLLDLLPPGGPEGGGQGGTAMALVHASPETVWSVLVNYTGHVGLYPRVVQAQVLELDPTHAVVRYEIGVGPFSFGFYVDNFPDATRHRIEWRLDHGRPNDLFRESWGYWQVERHGEDSLITYAMAARTVLPAFLTRGAERDGLVATVKAVRDRAQEPG
jgi:ribosome-associated toxin RatA of RatAB toxin-antitoxin module